MLERNLDAANSDHHPDDAAAASSYGIMRRPPPDSAPSPMHHPHPHPHHQQQPQGTQGQQHARGWLAGMLLGPPLVSPPSASTLLCGSTPYINSMAGSPCADPISTDPPEAPTALRRQLRGRGPCADPAAPAAGQESIRAAEVPPLVGKEQAAGTPTEGNKQQGDDERGDGSGCCGRFFVRCGAGADLQVLQGQGTQQQQMGNFPSTASEVRISVYSPEKGGKHYQGAGWQRGAVQYSKGECSIVQCNIDVAWAARCGV